MGSSFWVPAVVEAMHVQMIAAISVDMNSFIFSTALRIPEAAERFREWDV